MFESLSEKLNKTFKKLSGQGRLTERNIEDALKEVRLSLLEADVNYKVVKQFIDDIRFRAIGQEVLDSLTPGQQVIKIVNEALVRLMGGSQQELVFKGKPPYKIMLVGLQGSGKTTTAAKLALFLRKQAAVLTWSRPIFIDRPPLSSFTNWGPSCRSRFFRPGRNRRLRRFALKRLPRPMS